MSLPRMLTEKVRAKRILRAQQSIICLKLSGHNFKLGLLLDSGCGGGWLTEYYISLGVQVIGLDIHKWMWILKRRMPKAEFIRADARWIPFKNEVFQTVILNDVLEHVPYHSANRLLIETKRILSQRGRFYISVANRYQMIEPHTGIWFLTWLPRPCWDAVCKLFKRERFKCYPYTVGELRALCQKHNLLCENFTWVYASEKLRHPEYITNPITKALKKLKLLRATLSIAEKVSVIMFVCRKCARYADNVQPKWATKYIEFVVS